jgi:hypothetical protein
MQDNRQFIEDGNQFRLYIEDKYQGREVVSPVTGESRIVQDITDVLWENLDIGDQKLALKPEISWALGFGNAKTIEKSTDIRGYLFRPKQRDFFLHPCRYVAYFGGFGSGKTNSGVMKGIYLSLAYPGTRGLIMRETLPQLKTTTLSTMQDKIFDKFGWKEGKQYRHHVGDGYYDLHVGKDVSSRIWYRPAKNSVGDIQSVIKDLQSLEIDWVLIDEAVTVDMPIFIALQGRVGRWGKITDPRWRQLMVVGNPPSEDHYLFKCFQNKTDVNDQPLPNPEDYACYWASSYENKAALTKDYLRSLETMPPNWRDSFLLGQPGYLEHEGDPVYKTSFNYQLHVSKSKLPFDPNRALLTGWDINENGKYKAVVMGQIDNFGTLNILGEIVTDSPGIDAFCKNFWGYVAEHFPGVTRMLHYADPAAWHESQTGDPSQNSAAKIMARNKIVARPGEQAFALRRDSVDQLLRKLVTNGAPGICFNNDTCQGLIKGMQGGYAYKLHDEQSGRYSMTPIKNKFSHDQDALQYLCSMIGTVEKSSTSQQMRNAIKANQSRIYRRQGFGNRRR